MKILVDENVDQAFPALIPGHEAFHVADLGWQGTRNGALLQKAEEHGFEALISADKNMPYQQRFKDRRLFLVVLDIHPNILENQVACLPELDRIIRTGAPGVVFLIRGPHSKRPFE